MDKIVSKRKAMDSESPAPKNAKRVCNYGENCYRRNALHFQDYSHAHLESILDNYDGKGEYKIPDSLHIQRKVIAEQLNILVDNGIYAMGGNSGSPNAAVDSQSDHPRNNTKPTPTKNERSLLSTPKSNKLKINPISNTYKSASKTNKEIASNPIVDVEASSSLVKIDKPPDSKTESGKKDSTVMNNIVETKRDMSRESLLETKRRTAERYEARAERGYALDGTSGASRLEPSSAIASGSTTDGNSQTRSAGPGRRIEDYFSVVLPRGKMAEKHAKAAPFYIFYTTIASAPETHKQPLSITFQELLDPSLGALECSLQINFMVDIGWLMAQYYFAGYGNKPLTVLYGDETPDIRSVGQTSKHVETHFVQMSTPFGKHHTKMSMLCYADGSLRVVVSTANLYIDDWENRTQGLWLSPRCPPLSLEAMPHEGESPTGFKRSLLQYLGWYRLPCLARYIDKVKKADFSAINVFLVASVPGSHFDPSWGMLRAGALLAQHAAVPPSERHKWDVIAQSSSLGSYGKDAKAWLTGDFLHQFSRSASAGAVVSLSSPPRLRLVYPSLENVRGSHDGLLGGGCLPYAAASHTKQTWLIDYLHQWRAEASRRSRAMPHIKSYCRASPCARRVAYYLLTSGNVSKAAWGVVNKGNGALRVMSYEAGVLFLPKFVVNEDHFSLSSGDANFISIPYDIPPTPYESGMSPWVMDYLHD